MEEKNINSENQENDNSNELSEIIKETQNTEQTTEEAPEAAVEAPEAVVDTPIEVPAQTNAPITKPLYQWNYQEQVRADNAKRYQKQKNGKFVYAAVFVAVFALSLALLVGSFMLDGFVSRGTVVSSGGSVSALYEECLPSYVAISVTTPAGHGVGSGFIMTSDGYIATNYHVVEDAIGIKVILSDETSYTATLIDGDELNDIAVIKIDARGLTPSKIGTSKASKVGDQVIAIGTPHSIDYRGTMTSGYISALDRRYVEQNDNGTIGRVLRLIQTDTSVNPGNSGGPLFNMNGEVIGVVTLKISGVYEGLGFALPIESVIDIINDIIRNGKITNPDAGSASHGAALGITGFDVAKDTKVLLSGDYHYTVKVDPQTGEENVLVPTVYGYIEVPFSDKDKLEYYDITDYDIYIPGATGVYIVSAADGFDAAEKLQEGDILMSADGIECEQMDLLKSLIADKKVGDTIDFKVYRDGKVISITIELGRSSAMSD
jgi:S1-C subfamily serine protease